MLANTGSVERDIDQAAARRLYLSSATPGKVVFYTCCMKLVLH
jgi:hypothetical protein